MSICGTASPNLVASNWIGTNADGPIPDGVGVSIDAPGNTIGGTGNGAGNTIAFNMSDGVDVLSGSGNSIRQDLIYGNTGTAIVLSDTADVSQPPSVPAYTSVTSLTTIDYTVNGTSGDTYAIDFFASNGAGRPASVYLGSTSVTLNGSSQSFTATFDLPTPLSTARTSPRRRPVPTAAARRSPPPPRSAIRYAVTTGNDGVVGSLRQAILDADAAGGNPTITFTLPSPYQITPTSPLPAITQQVFIDGGLPATMGPRWFSSRRPDNGGGDGLTLGPGSDGSTIEGLAIGGFLSGAGIRVESNDDQILGDFVGVVPGTLSASPNALGIYVSGSDNTIGGSTAGAANAIADNHGPGVTVDSGIGDLISGERDREQHPGDRAPERREPDAGVQRRG